MPFMIGKAPIRRTLKYLNSCKVIFRDNVRIFSISYKKEDKDNDNDHHSGVREFVFWHLEQIQYNNPSVQVIQLNNLTPTPFIKIYLEDEEPLLIDLDSRTRAEIYKLLCSLSNITKTEEELKAEGELTDHGCNPTSFGTGCLRHCLCETHGQIPCPSIVPMPNHWKGIPSKEEVLHIPPHIKLWGLQQSANE